MGQNNRYQNCERPDRERFIFLDRDGTINVDTGYVLDSERVTLIAGSADAIGQLTRAGYRCVVVSSQSAIGRGIGTHEMVKAVNARVASLLLAEDSEAKITDWFYCPHAPDDGCLCRKPGTALVSDLLKGGFDLEGSWMIGDKISDVEFGLNLGLPEDHCVRLSPDGLFPDLKTVAAEILARPN